MTTKINGPRHVSTALVLAWFLLAMEPPYFEHKAVWQKVDDDYRMIAYKDTKLDTPDGPEVVTGQELCGLDATSLNQIRPWSFFYCQELATSELPHLKASPVLGIEVKRGE